MVDYEKATAFIERGTVEVAPLAFMRGRTLNDAFIILDEAQNTTEEQMKMFLTRLGYGSKAVVTGDITQVDLPTGRSSGLIEVQKVLRGVEGVSFCLFSEIDVVRHPLVQEVVRAYDLFEGERRARAEAAKASREGARAERSPAGPAWVPDTEG
jgi:phosphate starvation-inducible PhoH-like protein